MLPRLLERALKIEESATAPDHATVAVILNRLGKAHGCLGEFQRQRELLQRALAIEEDTYGPDHQEVAAFDVYHFQFCQIDQDLIRNVFMIQSSDVITLHVMRTRSILASRVSLVY